MAFAQSIFMKRRSTPILKKVGPKGGEEIPKLMPLVKGESMKASSSTSRMSLFKKPASRSVATSGAATKKFGFAFKKPATAVSGGVAKKKFVFALKKPSAAEEMEKKKFAFMFKKSVIAPVVEPESVVVTPEPVITVPEVTPTPEAYTPSVATPVTGTPLYAEEGGLEVQEAGILGSLGTGSLLLLGGGLFFLFMLSRSKTRRTKK